MKMLINTEKIKFLRNQKCWSQEHLSIVSGLSLRTIQRIESKGVASQESIKSLAAVYEVDCEHLLPEEKAAINNSEFLPTDTSAKNLLSEKDDYLLVTEEIKQCKVDNLKKTTPKRYIIQMLVIISANVFGLWGVFSAYETSKIDTETFSLLKNIVSINLLVCVAVVFYRGYRKGVFSFNQID